MVPVPDHGETSYVGAGQLTGRRAFITGGDSGTGRAVAIAFAREGADVAMGFLPEESVDAEETARWVRETGRVCVLVPADLRDEDAACAQRSTGSAGWTCWSTTPASRWPDASRSRTSPATSSTG